MNPARAKFLSWTLAALTGAALCLFVIWNIQHYKAKAQNVSTERMATLLNDTPEIIKDTSGSLVDYDQVRAALIDFPWTAPPQAPGPSEAPKPVVTQPAAMSVDKLVKVLGYSVDAGAPENSKAILKYLPEAKVRPPRLVPGSPVKEGIMKLVGSRLDEPLSHIRIVSITAAGVEFGFDDEERATETLTPADFDLTSRLAYVDPAQLRSRPDVIFIPRTSGYTAPAETVSIGRNQYRLGTEDMLLIGDDFPRILSEDVQTRQHRDPRTGRYDGIEITRVAPGSIAARHGAQTGDVVKSINGHPVSSQQEAINFVKNNEDMYDKWEIVVSNMGQERTVTYYPPEK